MDAVEALRDILRNTSEIVDRAVGDRPPEVAGVSDPAPLVRVIDQLLECVASELSGDPCDREVFDAEAQAAGFVIRDVRRFGSLLSDIVSDAVRLVRVAAPDAGVEVDDRVRWWTVSAFAQATHRFVAEVEARVGTDVLTGLRGRGAYEAELAALGRRNVPFTFVFADLDDLKGYNTREGYAAGDRALASMAERLTAGIADAGEVFRWGGDEFAALLPHVTSVEAAGLISRLREAEDPPFSYGIATFPDEASDTGDLVKTAQDRAKVDKELRKVDRDIRIAPASRKGTDAPSEEADAPPPTRERDVRRPDSAPSYGGESSAS